MARNYISKNKSKIAVIFSLFLHSILFLSLKTDISQGNTNKPIEFTEVLIVSGKGESILKKKDSQASQKKSNNQNQKNINPKMTKKLTTSNSKIAANSRTKKSINKQNTQKKDINKKNSNEAAKNHKSSRRGNKSKEIKDETLKGKLKGTGNTSIICKKCLEPVYSQKSIRKGLEGITKVKVTIDTSGLVKNAIIISSSGHTDIDNASIQAAIQSTFKPINEKVSINIRYEHKIKNYR